MSNVAHASLTGSNLHEPKGADTAAAGSVYVATGSGSGNWTASGTVVTGMVADFLTPIAPTGWLELDGSTISSSTYAALYIAMTITQTGNRTGSSAIVSGLSSTSSMKAGYYVCGTGITAGTQIASVDSSTQITMNANATSTGSASVTVSPWPVTLTTISLPNTGDRYRRSRATFQVGTTLNSAFTAHTHSGTASTSSDGSHAHTVGNDTPDHAHTINTAPGSTQGGGSTIGAAGGNLWINTTSASTTGTNVRHTHGMTTEGSHTHTVSFLTDSAGSSENRPNSIVFMTCVKT